MTGWTPINERTEALQAFEEARAWYYLMDRLDWVAAVFDPVHGISLDDNFNFEYAAEVGARVIADVLAFGGLEEECPR